MTAVPNIRILESDYERLAFLAEHAPERAGSTASFLSGELSRAAIVTDATEDTVQMGSRVRFRDDTDGRTHEFRLVYPEHSDPGGGAISVLTPVGSALLGLHAGATMQWQDRGGRMKKLTVLSVHNFEKECVT